MSVPLHRAALFLRMAEILDGYALTAFDVGERFLLERKWKEIKGEVLAEVAAIKEELIP